MTDYEIVDAMIQFGGGFVQALGRLFYLADAQNQDRLKKAFPEYWAKYKDLATLKAQKGAIETEIAKAEGTTP